MNRDAVTIKGRGSGVIEIVLSPSERYASLVDALFERMEGMRAFFGQTAPQCLIGGKKLIAVEKLELARLLYDRFGVETVDFADDVERLHERYRDRVEDMIDAAVEEAVAEERAKKVAPVEVVPDNIIVRNTVRNGQRVECEGDIIVLGDVNAGAELIAGGSIIVMGTLRGLAHAGATGRKDVVIAANRLMPKQLRIYTKAAIFPDEEAEAPEAAMLDDDEIVINAI